MATKKKSTKKPAKKTATARAKVVKTVALSTTVRNKRPPKLPSAWNITKSTVTMMLANWKLLLGIVAIYGVLNVVLVRGLSGGLDVAQLKHNLDQLSQGGLAHLSNGLNIFTQLISTSNQASSDVAGAYQTFLVIITSLALVWTFRQLRLGKTVRIRDGYYFGIYPMIPVLLILLVIGLQALPMLIGGWLFTTVVQTGIAISLVEQLLWGALFFALAFLSLYMMCSSIFALYIAALPGMTPVKALRSARGLVRRRRLAVLRKLVFLPFLLLVTGAIVMLPFILLLPVLAQWIFFGLGMVTLAVTHGYLYTLYRALLKENDDAYVN